MDIKENAITTVKVTGRELLYTLKKILDRANVVKVVIKRDDGKEILSVPGGYGTAVFLALPRLSFFLLASFAAFDYELVVHKES